MLLNEATDSGWSSVASPVSTGSITTCSSSVSRSRDIEGVANAGAAQLISPAHPNIQLFLHQGLPDLGEDLSEGDRFGDSVAVAPKFGREDSHVVVGVPREDVGGQVDVGLVHVMTVPSTSAGDAPFDSRDYTKASD